MAFTPDQFRKVNGYSNEYWGWGCEDDDMFVRIVHSCYNLEQADNNFYRYKMIIRKFINFSKQLRAFHNVYLVNL